MSEDLGGSVWIADSINPPYSSHFYANPTDFTQSEILLVISETSKKAERPEWETAKAGDIVTAHMTAANYGKYVITEISQSATSWNIHGLLLDGHGEAMGGQLCDINIETSDIVPPVNPPTPVDPDDFAAVDHEHDDYADEDHGHALPEHAHSEYAATDHTHTNGSAQPTSTGVLVTGIQLAQALGYPEATDEINDAAAAAWPRQRSCLMQRCRRHQCRRRHHRRLRTSL